MSHVDRTKRIPKFTGDVYYVSPTYGNDNNDGLSPETELASASAATALMTTGDAVVLGAGTYTENINLDIANCEMWIELGAQIIPPTGVALTVDGNFCRVECPGGALKITPASGCTGVVVNGNFCYLDEIRVAANSLGTLGFDLVGDGIDARRIRCSSPQTAAFKVQGDKIKLEDCCTGGDYAGSKGYWVTNSCDKTRLINCGSQGHSGGGFYVDSGVTNGCFSECRSGGGDGRWVDSDHSCVWSDFTYDVEKHKSNILASGVTTYNLFEITGAVRVQDIFGSVKAAVANTSSTIYLQAYSTNGTADVTDAPGTQIQADPIGTVYIRNHDATVAITKAEPDSGPVVAESADYRDPKTPIDIIADPGATTYLRLVLSDAVASGTIDWHIHWEPLDDDGFVETV